MGEIRSRNFPHTADFRLKCCILMIIAKNKTTGRQVADAACLSSPHSIKKQHRSQFVIIKINTELYIKMW